MRNFGPPGDVLVAGLHNDIRTVKCQRDIFGGMREKFVHPNDVVVDRISHLTTHDMNNEPVQKEPEHHCEHP